MSMVRFVDRRNRRPVEAPPPLAGPILMAFRLVILIGLVLPLGGADTLNPLVIRNEQPRGAAPDECYTGVIEAPPRIDTGEPLYVPAPVESVAAPPPSSTLRVELREAQAALERNDRTSFDEHRARVRQMLANYPRGGERDLAEEVLRIYDDAARLWSAQFESPFFSRDSNAYSIASAYPGFEEAIAADVWSDAAGQRFYPAAESRRFLAGVAARRLAPLGVQPAATPLPPVIPRDRSADTPRPVPERRDEPAAVPTPRESSTTTTGSGTAASAPRVTRPAADASTARQGTRPTARTGVGGGRTRGAVASPSPQRPPAATSASSSSAASPETAPTSAARAATPPLAGSSQAAAEPAQSIASGDASANPPSGTLADTPSDPGVPPSRDTASPDAEPFAGGTAGEVSTATEAAPAPAVPAETPSPLRRLAVPLLLIAAAVIAVIALLRSGK